MSHVHRHVNVARMPGFGDCCPPDDPPYVECELCNAKGWRMVLDEENKPVRIECEACEGYRYLDSEGYPYKGDDE